MIYIIIDNKKYYLDTCRITGRNLKLYIKISYFLNQKFQGIEINEEEFKRLKAEFITSFLVKKITVGYLLKNAIEEDLNITFDLLFNFLANIKKIDSLILKLFPQKEVKEEIIEEDNGIPKFNFGDDDDLEEEENPLEKILDMINSLYDFSMESLNCSFIDLEYRIDWFEFLDFLHFKLFRKKKLEENNSSSDKDIFEQEF